MFATPNAADAVGSSGGGQGRSLRTDAGGQLNPDWVEWLMGLPPGWTDAEADCPAPEYNPHIWDTEPDIPRVAKGIKNRVDRLKCLGNAVVPQQFYPVFKAIAEMEDGPEWHLTLREEKNKMNERYLFRGKRLDNGDWITGELSESVDGFCIFEPRKSVIGNYDHCKVDPSTVGQCTGLRDRTGELIFEGDIVKYIVPSPFEADEEKWDECAVSYEFGWYGPFHFISACDSQVIGNIHETPELMEGE